MNGRLSWLSMAQFYLRGYILYADKNSKQKHCAAYPRLAMGELPSLGSFFFLNGGRSLKNDGFQ